MRYDDRNAVTERVSSIVLQDYLIWTPAQVLEHLRQVLGAHKVGHSVFTMSKIFNKVFTNFFWGGFPVSYFFKQAQPCKAPPTISLEGLLKRTCCIA